MCSARASEVSSVTSKVERLRLLTPIRSAPASMARIQFAPVVNFDEGAEAIARGGLAEIADLARGEDGGDQQDGVRAVRRGLQDLRRVDGEILAQDGKGYGGAGGFEIGEAALEERLVGEHAEGGGAARLVGARDARRDRNRARGRPCWATPS